MARDRVLPLAGYRVVDITQVWAGPQLCSSMGDMGAEVIRVESLAGTDIGRISSVPKSDFRRFLESQRHSRARAYCITLNIAEPEGGELFRELISTTDIFVCNLSPRVQEKLGIRYQDLRPLRPDLIMATISAAGHTGPFRELMAYGPGFNAFVGHDSLVGYPDTGELMSAYWDPDPAMGVMGFYAVMLAIWHREETGEGQHVDLSFSEFLTGLLGEPVLEYQMTGEVPGPQGNLHPCLAPHNIYPSSGDDSWVSIAVGAEEEWVALCRVMEIPELASDPRFADGALRLEHREELDEIIGRWTRGRTHDEAMHLLQEVGVAATPAFNIGELYHDPHDTYRRTSVPVEAPGLAKEDVIYGIPWHLSETPGAIQRLGVGMGRDNDVFFSQVLGLPDDRIRELADRHVLR